MEEFAFSQGQQMRCGYTTGSCAAAATKAATAMLLSGTKITTVELLTPKGVKLELEPENIVCTATQASCAIRKDSGDDPDDTNGILIYADVEKTANGIELLGGKGVGHVTKPGLACAVGGPAINPTPRRMIIEAAQEMMKKYHYTQGLKITISIPEGEKIAQKTFNPRLGVVGGLSILGTSGIVEPMSDDALIKTMYAEMNSRSAAGQKNLLVFFGNYGEDFSRDVLHLNIANAVTCSNFVGDLLDYAVFKGFKTLLLIGHSGKLVKLGQGVMNTHSKYADCRTELMALSAMFHGADRKIGREIYNCLTTDEITKILKRENLFEPVMQDVTAKIDYYMQQRVHGKIKTAALLFSNVYGVLAKTSLADELMNLHKLGGTGNDR
jgi:cobalt-precorrin-5B (C1)-methyltransferase